MRRIVLFVFALLLVQVSFGQLTGSYTIPGAPYATIEAAISALNAQGVGAGGVTFNVTAGHTETFTSPTAGLITTTTGSSTNPIVFQKSGAGANPLVTAGIGTGTYDYIFCLGGTDYVTFDGISVQENAGNVTTTTQMEWGYAILKASATDGSQNNTIRNCEISLNSSNSATYAFYSNNRAYTAPGTTLTIATATGTNSNNRIYSNTITNCYGGIYLYGYASATPYAFYDQGNEIGVSGSNTINGLGTAAGTATAYGLYVYYQNDVKLANNNFSGTCANTTGALGTIYLGTSTNANVDVYGNTVSMTYNGTGTFYGIYNSGMGSSGTTNTVNYYNNSISGVTIPNHTSGTVYMMYISTGGVTANCYGNIVQNCIVGSAATTSTGSIYYLYFSSSPTTAGTTNKYNNTIQNNSRIQSVLGSGTTYILYTSGSGNVLNEYNNIVNNITTGSTSTTYGIYNLYSGTTKNVYGNTFMNIQNVNGLIYSTYNGNGSGTAYWYNNKIQNINVASGTGTLYGLYQSSGTTIYYYNNMVGELNAPNSANTIYGFYVSSGTTIGAYNNTIYLNASSTGTNFSVIGMYESTTPTVELRNNLVVNNSVANGTGLVVAHRRSSTTLTTYSDASDNNDFWAGTPGPANLIYYDGTNSAQTLAEYQTLVTPRDPFSITENPPFVNVTVSPYDLHLSTTYPTACESAGLPISTPVSITTDFDNEARYPNGGYPNNPSSPATDPDIGADEFAGLMFIAPTVVTTAATAVAQNTATINGTVNANALSSTVEFEYGLTTAYGSTIAGVPSPVTGVAPVAVSAPLAGLTSNTTYHFRVKATNSIGTSVGSDMSFTTVADPPTVNTDPASNIGVSTATLNGTVNANTASTTVTFEWGATTAYGTIVPGVPSPVTGNTPTAVSANIGGLVNGNTYHYRCVAVNSGGTTLGLDQSFIAGCQMPGPAGTITGPSAVCANSAGNIFSVAPVLNATGYQWTVPAGATITAGANTTTITVTFGTTAGNVMVAGFNGCGTGASSLLTVSVNPQPVPTVGGPVSTCQGTTNNVYTTESGMTGYVWSVSAGGSITAGAGTNTVTVTWNASGAQSVSVSYTNGVGCTPAAPTSYPVTVNTAPTPTVTGQTSMCVNSGFYNYTTEGGFTNYIWTVSAGGTINFGQGTSQVQVSWTGSGAQTVSVNYTNLAGCSAPAPVALPVTVNPVPGAAGTITGTATVCGGATGVAYSCAPIPNANAYVWSLPAGATITSGSGTNSIMVDFDTDASSGVVSVYGNNLCGNGAASPDFAVTVTALPADAGVITGQVDICQGTSGVIYTVPMIANATTYLWTVPAGATIVGGLTTATITVDFGLTAVSGDVTVYGSNSCGNGASSALAVTVNPIPETPAISLNLDMLSSSAATGNQWYYEGSLIPGATSQTYQATQSGWYWDVVTLNGCSSDTSNNIYVLITGVDDPSNGQVNIFPVPNNGLFTVSLVSPAAQNFRISVINHLGVVIRELPTIEVKGTVQQVIDLRPVSDGIYTVIIQSENTRMIRKIVVNK